MFNIKKSPPLALYVHLPWCIKKCPYCDFNSHDAKLGEFPENDYIEALIRDIDFILPDIKGRSICSIFIGGGTPSLFSSAGVDKLLTVFRARMKLIDEIEITLEANPGAVDVNRFQSYRDIGINRLSIGVQSFNDDMLGRLGRIHDANAALKSIEMARLAGFDHINIDLMYGLPEQHLQQALDDIQQAIDLGPTHLSWYQLTIEPNTVFYKHRPNLPDEDTIWTIQESGKSLISSARYTNYEISAYAYNGEQCRHNLNYWEFGDYIGIGAGAHSKLTDITNNKINRFIRHRLPDRYIQLAGGSAVLSETRELMEEDVILEFMMNTLRLNNGFKSSLFERRTGLPLNKLQDSIQFAENKGWLEMKDGKIRPTSAGQNYLNDLLQCFMNVPENKESRSVNYNVLLSE